MNEQGPLSVVDTGRGLSVFYRGRHLYSARDPEAAPASAAERARLLPESLYIVPSPCLCYGLPELLKKLPPSSFILCVDVDPALHALALKRASGLKLEHPRLMFTLSANKWQVLRLAREKLGWKRVELMPLGGGYSLDRSFYDGLAALFQDDARRSLRNRVTLTRMGRLWTRNLFSNLGRMDWDRVRGGTPGVPPGDAEAVIVCGAGPSLDAALPFLQRAGGRLRVMACDTACGPLAVAGVRVDDAVCLEGQVYNVADFLPLRARDALLWADLSSHPSGFRAFSGPVRLVASAYSDSSLHARLAGSGLPITGVPPLGSVGVLALRLARLAYGGPVLFTGLDFSFPPGRSHCANSPAAIADRRSMNRLKRGVRAWASSYRDGVGTLASGWLCDPTLGMYAELAACELDEGGESGTRYVDLRGPWAHPLPSEAMTIAEAETWVDGLVPGSVGAPPSAGGLKPGMDAAKAWKQAALAFLHGELEAVARLRQALAQGADEETLRSFLGRSDFCWSHFPDPERVAALELDALKRVAAECAYWSQRLDAALSMMP